MPVIWWILYLILSFYSSIISAEDKFYCPQRHAYVHTGMSPDLVLDACGAPDFKKQSDGPVVERIPVMQVFYTNLNRGAVFQGWDMIYNTWTLPSGELNSSIQINLIDNKVDSMVINNSATNVLTVCGGKSIQKGDPLNYVISTCGTPSMMNHSFVSKVVSQDSKPEVWIYKIDEYQKTPVSLTFVNGILQSINR
jgi:hypothetical protein